MGSCGVVKCGLQGVSTFEILPLTPSPSPLAGEGLGVRGKQGDSCCDI